MCTSISVIGWFFAVISRVNSGRGKNMTVAEGTVHLLKRIGRAMDRSSGIQLLYVSASRSYSDVSRPFHINCSNHYMIFATLSLGFPSISYYYMTDICTSSSSSSFHFSYGHGALHSRVLA